MNTVGLTGRLTKAPATRYGGQDNSVAITRFTLAVDDAGGADFINIKCLGRTAEWAEKWLSKGSKVEVTGKIKARQGNQSQPATDDNGFMNIPDGIDEELPFS